MDKSAENAANRIMVGQAKFSMPATPSYDGLSYN